MSTQNNYPSTVENYRKEERWPPACKCIKIELHTNRLDLERNNHAQPSNSANPQN